MEHLTDIYHLDAIPHNARGFDTRDWTTPEIFERMAAPLMEAYKVTRAILFVYILFTRRWFSGTSGRHASGYSYYGRQWTIQL
jgi:hypothetical protein